MSKISTRFVQRPPLTILSFIILKFICHLMLVFWNFLSMIKYAGQPEPDHLDQANERAGSIG
jgi:hypothetical protein